MRIAILVPDPGYPEPWRWSFDPQASALAAAGAEVEPIVWTDADDLSAFDLVLPLVAWGYHLKYRQWLAFLDRIEAAGVPMINPPALLRWNSDISPSSATPAFRPCRRSPLRHAAMRTSRKPAGASDRNGW